MGSFLRGARSRHMFNQAISLSLTALPAVEDLVLVRAIHKLGIEAPALHKL